MQDPLALPTEQEIPVFVKKVIFSFLEQGKRILKPKSINPERYERENQIFVTEVAYGCKKGEKR
jgi:hypothetical protein